MFENLVRPISTLMTKLTEVPSFNISQRFLFHEHACRQQSCLCKTRHNKSTIDWSFDGTEWISTFVNPCVLL